MMGMVAGVKEETLAHPPVDQGTEPATGGQGMDSSWGT